MTYRLLIASLIICGVPLASNAEKLEPIKFGDFENWVSRDITESVVIGGKHKTIYEVGPTQNISKNIPYKNLGGSPWATSNVYAKVSGVT
ncbi:MAG: glycoside hydrolase xylanase, partial [Paramuribaculum sp.]|nr:glycoside hydrolase xylanase [Paramuribaculum sp.]